MAVSFWQAVQLIMRCPCSLLRRKKLVPKLASSVSFLPHFTKSQAVMLGVTMLQRVYFLSHRPPPPASAWPCARHKASLNALSDSCAPVSDSLAALDGKICHYGRGEKESCSVCRSAKLLFSFLIYLKRASKYQAGRTLLCRGRDGDAPATRSSSVPLLPSMSQK